MQWETAQYSTWDKCRVADTPAGRFLCRRASIGNRRWIVKLNGKGLTLNGAGFESIEAACKGAEDYLARWTETRERLLREKV